MKVLAKAHDLKWLNVASAGLLAYDGDVASLQSVSAVAEFGGDLNGFHSRRITQKMVDEADLIIGMTASHRHDLVSKFTNCEQKVKLLLEFDPEKGDNVSDPYGGSLDLYRFTLAAMLPALEALTNEISNNQLI